MNEPVERTTVGDRVTIFPIGKRRIYVADFHLERQHCRRSLKTSNRKVAVERATKLAFELTTGGYHVAPAEMAISTAVDMYISFLTTERRAPKTLVKYAGIFKLFMEFLKTIHVIKLNRFTTTQFDRYRAHRAETRQAKTLYVEGVVIKQFFKWCLSRKLIVENPIVSCKLKKPSLLPKEGPGLNQVDAMLLALPPTKKPMIALLAFTGMRAGELQRLQPSDIDLVGNWVHIISRAGLETKTRDSRKVPIHPRLFEILETMPKSHKPWLFTMLPSRKYPDGDHMVNIKKLNEEFQKIVKSLKMPTGRVSGFTLHSLRHFFETCTVNAGIRQRVVDTWLGHRSDKSMAAVYYRLRDEDSQSFMKNVPFGTGATAAEAVEES